MEVKQKMNKIGILSVMAILLLAVGVSAGTIVDVNMDVDSGIIDITADSDLGTDAEARTHFYGWGGFVGNFNADDNDGILDTLVGVSSKGTYSLTGFSFESSHNLGSKNNNDNKMVFDSWVQGETATMDIRMDNSPYQSQAERVSGRPMLFADSGCNANGYDMGYNMINTKRDDSYTNAETEVLLFGYGTGSLGKIKYGSNHFARGVGYNSNALDIRSGEVTATGDGFFSQYGRGDNSLEFNGFNLGSGNAQFIANFAGGFSGEYSIYAK